MGKQFRPEDLKRYFKHRMTPIIANFDIGKQPIPELSAGGPNEIETVGSKNASPGDQVSIASFEK
jgi:hypothetical protein